MVVGLLGLVGMRWFGVVLFNRERRLGDHIIIAPVHSSRIVRATRALLLAFMHVLCDQWAWLPACG